MIHRMKPYAFTMLLTLVTSASLHSMELTPDFPFNIKHKAPSGFNKLMRLGGGYYGGYMLGAAMGAAGSASLMIINHSIQEYRTHNKQTISSEELGFIVGATYISAVVGCIGTVIGQIQYWRAADSLNQLAEDKTFLDIIQIDDGICARAWLGFYNKASTSKNPYKRIAYPSYCAQHATIKNNRGQTALMLAAQYGSINVAKELLEAGAQIDAHDPDGNTALDYALQTNNLQMIALLSSTIN